MAYAKIDVLGTRELETELVGIGQRAVDLEPIWEEIEDWLCAYAEEQFKTDGGHGQGGGWAPLKESTIARKRNDKVDNGILRATMALHDSLVNPMAEHQIADRTPSELRFGSDLLQFQLHSRGSSHYPKREIFDFTRPQENQVRDMIRDFVVPPELYSTSSRRASSPPRWHTPPSFSMKTGRMLPPRDSRGRFMKMDG